MRAPLIFAVSALIAVAACGGRKDAGGESSSVRPAKAGAQAPDSGVRGNDNAVRGSGESAGEWTLPEVVTRLTEAGLVVSGPTQSARHAPLTVTGHLLHVSGGTLEVYLYPSASARAPESATLDTVPAGLPSINNARYIISGNLVGILLTPDDRTAERVSNALEARHTGN